MVRKCSDISKLAKDNVLSAEAGELGSIDTYKDLKNGACCLSSFVIGDSERLQGKGSNTSRPFTFNSRKLNIVLHCATW